MHPVSDLEVGHTLLEQLDDLPAMRERLQLTEGAEVAQEAPELVAVAQRAQRVGELVEAGDLLDVMSGSFAVVLMRAMLAC